MRDTFQVSLLPVLMKKLIAPFLLQVQPKPVFGNSEIRRISVCSVVIYYISLVIMVFSSRQLVAISVGTVLSIFMLPLMPQYAVAGQGSGNERDEFPGRRVGGGGRLVPQESLVCHFQQGREQRLP